MLSEGAERERRCMRRMGSRAAQHTGTSAKVQLGKGTSADAMRRVLSPDCDHLDAPLFEITAGKAWQAFAGNHRRQIVFDL